MALKKSNAGILGLAKRVAGSLIRHPSREPRAVTVRARAAALAAVLVLLGLFAPAQVQGVEELLETLIVPIPVPSVGPPFATGTVPLRQGATYRIVATGIVTNTEPGGTQMFDALYFFFPGGPAGPETFGNLELRIGDFTFVLTETSLPFNLDHRYERTFVSQFNGVLRARMGNFQGTVTSTLRVELFGEPAPATCDGRSATIEAIPEVPTFGTSGDDVIVGTEGADQLFGLGGRDIICGLGGNDVISGNSGSDRLFGGPGDDQIAGGDDDARDFLFGEDDQDRLSGGKGNDVLDGGPGVDRMIGGPGNDTLFVNGVGLVINSDGTFTRQGDVLLGGPDEDLADYSQLPGPVRVNLRRGNKRQRGGGEILNSIEDLRGTPGDDRLIGDDEDNSLFGGGGNDLLDVRDFGLDFAAGEPGSDTCIGTFDEDANERDRARGCENVIER